MVAGVDGVASLARCGFFLPQHPDLVAGELWPSASWPDRFDASEEAWIAQTFLRLRAAGHEVRACDAAAVPDLDLVVVHPAQLGALLGVPRRPAVAVTIADKTYGAEGGDFLITQNDLHPGGNRVFVPHWPQPGLVPRDPARQGLTRAAFKGRTESLHPELRTSAWHDALAALGIDWRIDDVEAPGAPSTAWRDYHDVDLVVALRPPDRDQRKAKPATKLANAWLAGVPALLGVEEQYREWRNEPDDYLEVADPAEALTAIERLRGDPGQYERLARRAQARAADVSVEAVTQRWVDALVDLHRRATTRGRPAATYRRAMQWVYRRRVARGPAATQAQVRR